MAFLRFTRDKRGYEHFYLVQPSHSRGRSTARVLYWFRTPPSVKVGREPFDESIRRELEAQNPDVTFDWRKILETPIPSADAEKWRDRRRAERAAKAAKRGAVVEAGEESPEDGEEDSVPAAPVHVLEAAAESAGSDVPDLQLSEPPDLTVAAASNERADPQAIEPGTENNSIQLRPLGSGDGSHRKRRRRRRRRGHTGSPGSGGNPPAGPAGDV